MGRPQSVGGGRPHRVATALSDREKDTFDRLRGGLSPADYLRLLINRDASARSSSSPPPKPMVGSLGPLTEEDQRHAELF